MRTKAASLAIVCLALLAPALVPAFALHPPPEASSVGKKGPVQLALRLYKTKVKVKKSLWFQLELKNIGKENIWVSDRAFRDIWQLYWDCKSRNQSPITIEVQAVRFSDGKPAKYDPEGYRDYLRYSGPFPEVFLAHYDYIGGPDDPALGKAVNDRLDKLEAQWSKEGLSELQKKVKRHDFWEKWNREMRDEEDRAKSFWLAPGASTATAAWAYPGGHEDELETLRNIKEAHGMGYSRPKQEAEFLAEYDLEKQVGDYAQLWFYQFNKPGRYKVRAVYRHAPRGFALEFLKERGRTPSSWEVDVKTPYIEFEVLP